MFLWESSILKDTLKRDICYIMQIFIEKLQIFFPYKAEVFQNYLIILIDSEVIQINSSHVLNLRNTSF